ncbi:MAG: hypothetical protein M1816_006158 [Peltula sp. TS41687]|nr:MAG: hypothetical protein M1816_006158 [Peltula sp. TS41687]
MNLTNWLLASALFFTTIYCLPAGQPPEGPGNPKSSGGEFIDRAEQVLSLDLGGRESCILGYLKRNVRAGPDGRREFGIKQWLDALEHCGAFVDSPRPQIDESSPAMRGVWRIPAIDEKPFGEGGYDEEENDDGRGPEEWWSRTELRLLPAASSAAAGGHNLKIIRWVKNTVDNLSRIGSSKLSGLGSALRQNPHGVGNQPQKMSGVSIPVGIPPVFSY